MAKLRKPLIIIIFFIFIMTPALANEYEKISLKNDDMVVTIIPATLEVRVNSSGTSVISEPQKEMNIKNLVSCSDSASWDIPAKHMSVYFKITGKKIKVKFVSNTEGAFTWPVAGSDCKAYILPLFEGSYVPANDSKWLTFLMQSSPMDTEEALSMPFWGLLYRDHTLTFIIENPFNNEINFYNDSSSLGLNFTHRFTKNRAKKEYGFTIISGNQSPVEPAKKYREYLMEKNYFVTMEEKIKDIRDAKKLAGAAHIYLWGDGVSLEMLQKFQEKGFDRLWLGLDSWHDGLNNPDFVKKAMNMGYLVAPYDSYNSIHDPNDPGWETAVFDKELYEKGAIVNEKGKKMAGFMGKGYLLSPIVSLPYVQKRVSGIMEKLRFNSWFIDCDAYGQLYDDYSPLHPATKEEDMNARCERMAWIRDNYKAVIGSEKGAWYAAHVIHFAHGMLTPVFGWDDRDMNDKNSEYFPGTWWPPEEPAVFMKQVPLKEKYSYIYYAPQFRLPLYEIVFHDSVIVTHHWQYHSLKFKDQVDTVELLEILYNVPPLYHLNLKEFEKHRDRILKHYRFFSPIHKETALLPMSDFACLTEDRMMQKTVFGNKIEVIANFYSSDRKYGKITVPAKSVCVRNLATGDIEIFTP